MSICHPFWKMLQKLSITSPQSGSWQLLAAASAWEVCFFSSLSRPGLSSIVMAEPPTNQDQPTRPTIHKWFTRPKLSKTLDRKFMEIPSSKMLSQVLQLQLMLLATTSSFMAVQLYWNKSSSGILQNHIRPKETKCSVHASISTQISSSYLFSPIFPSSHLAPGTSLAFCCSMRCCDTSCSTRSFTFRASFAMAQRRLISAHVWRIFLELIMILAARFWSYKPYQKIKTFGFGARRSEPRKTSEGKWPVANATRYSPAGQFLLVHGVPDAKSRCR